MKRSILAVLSLFAILLAASPAGSGSMTLLGVGKPSSGAPFTPASMPNIYAWSEADVGVLHLGSPATNGQTADTWINQIGGGAPNLTQGGVGTDIVYQTSFLNGLPVIRNGGATSNMIATYALGGSTVSVCVLVQETFTSFGRVASYNVGGIDTGPTGFIAAYFNSDTNPIAYNSGNLSSGTVVASSWNQICSIWDGVNNTLYVANLGATPVVSAPTFAASGTFTLFDKDPIGNALTGSIAAFVVVKGVISGPDMASLESYWFAKWAVH